MLKKFNLRSLLCPLLLIYFSASYGIESTDIPTYTTQNYSWEGNTPIPPSRSDVIDLEGLSSDRRTTLQGLDNVKHLEFTLRNDQVITSAELKLSATPSPALLPKLSHLRVYLNDELMKVISVVGTEPGARFTHNIPLDPMLMRGFNRISLEFVGHYTNICEDLSHTSIWLEIGNATRLVLNQQTIPFTNDLSFFPEPFYDSGDMQKQVVPFVFSDVPGSVQLQAAAILSSYFGSKAAWRNITFPAYYNNLPFDAHAVIFATNESRPDFLVDYPKVQEPTIDMISDPDNPYIKRLLVLGRDDSDLLIASRALALETPLLRGKSVQIKELIKLDPRKPYDAPNWVSIDRPVKFAELVDYPGQLEVSGLKPRSINLNLALPPDLFVWRNNGIPTDINYRFTPLENSSDSRLILSLNDQFLESYSLRMSKADDSRSRLRLPIISHDRSGSSRGVLIPAMKLGSNNDMKFDFSFAAALGSSQHDECRTVMPVEVRAAIDDSSTIDFSGMHHYLEMPNLYAFASAGYPFSRMADLSETIALVPPHPTTDQTSLLLEAVGNIGARVGYPAMALRVMHDWDEAVNSDADLLLIGDMPKSLRQANDVNLLLDGAVSSLKHSNNYQHTEILRSYYHEKQLGSDSASASVTLSSIAPIAALIGMQSPIHETRSIVGLLASSGDSIALLRDALNDAGKREVMRGSVVMVRDSGVASALVGNTYYVGNLPWWNKLWFNLSSHPVLLAILAVITVLLVAFLLWSALRWVAIRRLERDV